MFSRRTGWSREITALSAALAARRQGGLAAPVQVIDLTASNPTRCGFEYQAEGLIAPLGNVEALEYEPDPFGIGKARDAVCAYYRELGADTSPDLRPEQVCLTTSTSEAYSFLFRLLCDPGDEVLIAQPSYPLFDFLADLENVHLAGYPLVYDHGWLTEPGVVRARITSRTRAIVVVHPNNPTGHYVTAAERAELQALCSEFDLALIVDEVFLDYSFDRPARSFADGDAAALTFVLSGLSKVAALPQMKASWIVTRGPEEKAREALARLELIADTFLSMNTPVQHALPAWLAGRGAMQAQIKARTRANLASLDELLAGDGLVRRLAVEAGWYAVLRVPALGSDDALALELLEGWGVLVHPGHYYGFGLGFGGGAGGNGWLVVSLLPPPEVFAAGVRAIVSCCARKVGMLASGSG
jgi:aspartate/methionine/tyrosine aminotransferase